MTETEKDVIQSEKTSGLKFKDYQEFKRSTGEDIEPIRIRDDKDGNKRYILNESVKSNANFRHILSRLNSFEVRELSEDEMPEYKETGADYSFKEIKER